MVRTRGSDQRFAPVDDGRATSVVKRPGDTTHSTSSPIHHSRGQVRGRQTLRRGGRQRGARTFEPRHKQIDRAAARRRRGGARKVTWLLVHRPIKRPKNLELLGISGQDDPVTGGDGSARTSERRRGAVPASSSPHSPARRATATLETRTPSQPPQPASACRAGASTGTPAPPAGNVAWRPSA